MPLLRAHGRHFRQRLAPVCRFYARMGKVHLYAYRAEGLDEVELTWYKDL